MKQVLVKLSKKVTLQNRYNINSMFCHKTFVVDHVLLTCRKHTGEVQPRKASSFKTDKLN